MRDSLKYKRVAQLQNYTNDLLDKQGNYLLLYDYINHISLRRIIDVGAWWGPWTITWQNNAEQVEIFEPNQKILPKLKHNISNFKNCTLHETALGNKSGNVSMTQTTHSGTYHVSKTDGSIKIKTLDSYNFDNVDVIKIDAEGYELPILQGARNTIIKNRPWIQIEANKACLRYKYTKRELMHYLMDMGMERVTKKHPDQIWKF